MSCNTHSPKGKWSQQYLPCGFLNVVISWLLAPRETGQKPDLASSYENMYQYKGPEPDDEIVDICKTTHLYSEGLGHYLLEHKNEVTIFCLNISSIRSKFDQLLIILSELCEGCLAFSALCLQESWWNEHGDIAPFLIPGHSSKHLGKVYSQHGGSINYDARALTSAYSRNTGTRCINELKI